MTEDVTDRLDRLESLVEQQQATIEAQRDRIAELEGEDASATANGDATANGHAQARPAPDASGDTAQRVSENGSSADAPDTAEDPDGTSVSDLFSRRSLLQGAAVLGLGGYATSTASAATPRGNIGTSEYPIGTLYLDALTGPITGGTTLTSLTGDGLTIAESALAIDAANLGDATGVYAGTSESGTAQFRTLEGSGSVDVEVDGDVVTIDGSDSNTNTQTDVSDSGTTKVQSTDDIDFDSNLTVSDDGDGSVTVDVSSGVGKWEDSDTNSLLEPKGSETGIDVTDVQTDNLTDDGSGQVTMGNTLDLNGNAIQNVGGTTDASTGDIRLNESATIAARDSGNSNDIGIANLDGSDNLIFGNANTTTTKLIGNSANERITLGGSPGVQIESQDGVTVDIDSDDTDGDGDSFDVDGYMSGSTTHFQVKNDGTVNVNNGTLDLNGNDLTSTAIGTDFLMDVDSGGTQAGAQYTIQIEDTGGSKPTIDWARKADADEALRIYNRGSDTRLFTVNDGGEVDVHAGPLDLNSNNVNNVKSIDGGGSAISVDTPAVQLKQDGSASNAALAWTNDVDTGLYRNAQGDLRLVANSGEVLGISDTGITASENLNLSTNDINTVGSIGGDGGEIGIYDDLSVDTNPITSASNVIIDINHDQSTGSSDEFKVTKEKQATNLLKVNDTGEVDVCDGPLDLNSNNVNNVKSIDGGGSAISVDDPLNLSASDSIQASGTDAISFDGSQNVTIANGTLTVTPSSNGTTLDVQDKDGNSLLVAKTSGSGVSVYDPDESDSLDFAHSGTNAIISTSSSSDLRLSPSGAVDLNGNNLTSVNSVNGSVTSSQITQLDGAGLTVNSGSLDTDYTGAAVSLSSDQTLSSADSDISVQFDTEAFDTGNNFDTSNYKFTAPRTGFYSVNAQVTVNRQASNDYIVKLQVNGSTPAGAQVRCTDTEQNASIGRTLNLTSGDTISVVINLDSNQSSDVIRSDSNLSIDFEGQ